MNTAIAIIAVAPAPPCFAWSPGDIFSGALVLTFCICAIIFILQP